MVFSFSAARLLFFVNFPPIVAIIILVAFIKTNVTFTVVGGNKASRKALKVNRKTGNVTVRKGTKKGGYTLKLKVNVKASKKYKIFEDIANVSFRPDRVFWTNKVSQYLNYVIKKQPKTLEKQEYPILASHNLYYIAGDSKHVIIWIK